MRLLGKGIYLYCIVNIFFFFFKIDSSFRIGGFCMDKEKQGEVVAQRLEDEQIVQPTHYLVRNQFV